MYNSPERLAREFVDNIDKCEVLKEEGVQAKSEIIDLEKTLESMAPSKLSTLTDEWVRAFTPFRSKITLVAFLVKMVLPNMQYAW